MDFADRGRSVEIFLVFAENLKIQNGCHFSKTKFFENWSEYVAKKILLICIFPQGIQ